MKKEILTLRKRRTGQWVTVSSAILIGSSLLFSHSVQAAENTATPLPADTIEMTSTDNKAGELDEGIPTETSKTTTSETDALTTANEVEATPSIATTNEENAAENTENSPKPETPNPEIDFTYTVNNQEVTITGLKQAEGVTNITIPEVIDKLKVTSIGDGAFANSDKLSNITLPQGLQTIGNSAFGNTNLTSITIPEGVTHIGDYAFQGTKLTEITLPGSLESLGYKAFGDIPTLKRVNVPVKLKYAYQAFEGSNVDTVTFDQGVEYVPEHMFYNNASLTSITLPPTLKRIGSSAFNGTNISNITIPEGVTHIESYAFQGTKLTEITLPSSLESLGYKAFGDIPTLTKAHITKGLTSSSAAFAGNPNLKEVTFEEGITKIPDAILSGTGIEALVIPETVTSIGDGAFANSDKLSNITLPQGLKTIGQNAFSNTNLTSITIPEGVTHIESYAFQGTKLTEITLPSSLESLGYKAFTDIPTLKRVNVPVKLKYAYQAFEGSNVDTVTFDQGVEYVPEHMFYNNASLTSITLPPTLKRIGSSAFNGTNISNITIPEGVTHIESYAFQGTKLTEITLPSSLEVLGYHAFGETKIQTLDLPEKLLTSSNGVLATYWLSGMDNLKSIYLPRNTVRLEQTWGSNNPWEPYEYHVFLDSPVLNDIIDKQLNFKLRDENVTEGERVLDRTQSYYITTSSSTRQQGYIGLDLKYSIIADKMAEQGNYRIRLNVPSSLAVHDNKVKLNGVDTTVTVSNGYMEIPVTEATGKLKFTLATRENKELTSARLFAQLVYDKDNNRSAETIGAINVNVPILTLESNKATSRSYAKLSGIADPNDRLTAYVDDTEVAKIDVKKDGSYAYKLPLPNLVNNKEYRIKVVATSPSGSHLSEERTVTYEESISELENFTMRHNGYTYDLKQHGDTPPVIVFRPGADFEFEVEYTNTEGKDSLYLISTREGVHKVIELPYDFDKEKYIFKGRFDENNPSYVPGKLTLYLEPGVTPLQAGDFTSERATNDKGDTDGDGLRDIIDPDPTRWNVSDRDLAIFTMLAYKNLDELKEVFKNKGFTSNGLDFGKTDKTLFENWKFVTLKHYDGVDTVDVAIFKNEQSKDWVISVRGTDGEQFRSKEWIDNYIKLTKGISKDKAVIRSKVAELLPTEKGYNVHVTGHSRGSYLAYHLSNEIQKYQIRENKSSDFKLASIRTFNGVGLVTDKEGFLHTAKGAIIGQALGGGLGFLTGLFFEGMTTEPEYKTINALKQLDSSILSYFIEGDIVNKFGTHPSSSHIGIPFKILPEQKEETVYYNATRLLTHEQYLAFKARDEGVNVKNQEKIVTTELSHFWKFTEKALEVQRIVVNM